MPFLAGQDKLEPCRLPMLVATPNEGLDQRAGSGPLLLRVELFWFSVNWKIAAFELASKGDIP
jgi:hypothetical protein